jgi:hypothetical protein
LPAFRSEFVTLSESAVAILGQELPSVAESRSRSGQGSTAPVRVMLRRAAIPRQTDSIDSTLRSAAARNVDGQRLQRRIPQVVGPPSTHLVEQPRVDTAMQHRGGASVYLLS